MKLFDHLDESVPLGDDERLLFDAVRALCRDKIAPRAAGHDRNGDFPWDNVADINQLGLNAMFLAEAYGGADLSYTAYLACVREISKACASTGVIWSTNFHAMNPVAEFGPAALQKRMEEANGSRRNLPGPADKPETFGSARQQPRHY